MKSALIILALLPARAFADEPTAADVENAPLPGEESGRTDKPKGDSLLRNIGQAALVPPRIAVEVAMAPVRAGIWTFDRYQLADRFTQIFFDKSETYGLYPTAVLDSSYGLTLGARFVHRDLFGKREHFALRGGAGGEFRARATADLRTGTRLGDHTQLELGGEFERRPNDAFYGIGSSTDDTASHHRQELLRAKTALDVRVVSALHLRGAGALTDLAYAATDEAMPIDIVYPPSVLTGWPGTRNLYGELEVRWDRRENSERGRYQLYNRGWLVAGFAGRVHQLVAGNDYWRYGGDLQYHLRLGHGPRAIGTRLHLESVTGELSDVAFTELPQLGGKVLLRGYPRDRFRDRNALAGTVEYEWDLSDHLIASLFVDGGRVFDSYHDVPTNIRMGYGVSIALHDNLRYAAGITLASSIDGGVFIDLTFDPVFDGVEHRLEQR